MNDAEGDAPGANDRKVRGRCYTLDFENEGRGHESQLTRHAASRSCRDKQQPHPHLQKSVWKENGPYYLTCSHTDPVWPRKQHIAMLWFHTQKGTWGLSQTPIPHQMG